MHLNTDTPEKPRVNLTELSLVLTAYRRAWRPGTCGRTLLAGIVATGAVSGLDLSQEVDFAAPRLLGPVPTEAPLMVASR